MLTALLALLLAPLAPAPTAGLWVEPSLPPAVPLATIRQWLDSAGLQPVELDSQELLDPSALAPERLRLLVLPYAGAYPVAGHAALDRYLSGGGSYLAVGGPPFTLPLFQVGGGLVAWDRFGEPVASLEAEAQPPTMQGPDDRLSLAGRGTATDPLTVALPDLEGWAYAGFALPALPAQAAGLEFEARGEPGPLAVELTEQDGSRWKQLVELGPAWRRFRLHTGSFAAYASPARAGADDYFHPERGRALFFGLTVGLAGKGAHRFELRGLRCLRALVAAEAVPARLAPLTIREPVSRAFPGVAAAGQEWPGLSGAALAPPGARVTTLAGEPLDGVAPHQLIGPASDGLKITSIAVEPSRAGQWRPWLTVASGEGQPLGSAAGWWEHSAGRYAGGAWGVVGAELSPSPALNAALAAMLRAMVCPPLLGPLTASYAVADGQVTRTWRQTLVGRAEALRLEVEPAANHLAGAAELKPREVREVTWPGGQVTSLADLTARFASRLRVGDVVYPTETTLDYREQLVKLADFLAREGEDGKFSGIAFIDHRGVRALLGAYEVTGERRYLETALRWGQAMVAEQRDDGGYRMGYGITSRGEECYVADGGEIALGMARLVPYAAAAERPRLMQSLAGYFAYRESFRVPSGGIGVGWCLSDYGQRPFTPLATPTRIYAPELNTYTIGCTLAAAYAYAALTGDPALERQAEADADWLMPRLKSLSGASGESFCWAHALTTDPARRQLYADYLRTHLVAPLLARKPLWWLNSGGRASLDLDLLVYYYTRVSRQPEVLAAIATAATGMFDTAAPGSVHRFLGRPNLGHDPWLYLCFSGVGLADLVQPLVTLRGFERQTAGGVNSPGGGGPAG